MILKMPFVAHPTKNMDQAKAFYENVLGFKLEHDYGNGAWVEFSLPDGNTLALETYSQEGPYLALETDDIAKEVSTLRERGTNVLRDVWENKDAEGQLVCKMALIADPDGNHLLLHEIAPRRR